MFPSTSSRETMRFSGNKIHCSPRDQSLSVYYCSIYTGTRATRSIQQILVNFEGAMIQSMSGMIQLYHQQTLYATVKLIFL